MKEYLIETRDIIKVKVVQFKDYKNYLMLGYYRNPINHVFFNEGLVIAAINSFDYA